jgi:hypothetical protein
MIKRYVKKVSVKNKLPKLSNATQTFVVVKDCLESLPARGLLLWGNLTRDRLLQKAYFAFMTIDVPNLFKQLKVNPIKINNFD